MDIYIYIYVYYNMGYIIGFAAYPSEMGLLDFSTSRQDAPACAMGLLNEMQSKRLRVDEVPCPIWTSLDSGRRLCRLVAELRP